MGRLQLRGGYIETDRYKSDSARAIGIAPVGGLVSPTYVVVRPFPKVDCRYFTDVVTGKVDACDIEVPEISDEELLVLDDANEVDEVIDDELEMEVEG